MIIRARAPLRLGLAGGGTDVSPYCDLYGGCVLNATIDRYAYAVLEVLTGNRVQFCSADRQHFSEYELGEPIPRNGCVDLHRAVYLYMIEQFNEGRPLPVKVTTYCDAPVGSGLGSSSTLVVAMLKAFAELLNVPLDDYALAHLAFRIERVDCGLQGGRQDQYAATFGGFNFIEFYADNRVVVNPLRIKNWIICELEASLVLFFTGVSRSSAKIIADQSTNVEAGTDLALSAMHAMKREACTMKESLLKGDFAGLVESMREGWTSKKCSAKSVSNPHIDEIYEAAVKAGALAGKVSGAGGGGFMMFFVPPEKRMDVIFALRNFSGQVSNCHFTKYGMQGWKID
ncbi:MAG: dehydrogenase [Nitrospirota bacterium]|nr:dehydrogenase [Nitrospirota bacterium]MDH5699665.1 dehydrogenase [Nitrospirota bacterium]